MTKPLLRAHAHNDYAHTRPLLDALDQGFCSVEADIYLENGALLVGHDKKDLRPERTLTALYLEPLWQRVKANQGSVYPEAAPLTLLVDIKTDGARVYAALKESLKPYAPMLTRFENGQIKRRAITVILSGDRPREILAAERNRLAALDGRPDDLGKNLPVALFPLISESWFTLFKWYGTGLMTRTDREKLSSLIEQAHTEGRTIRFWAAPDNPAGWEVCWSAGVDYLNTDKLPELATFLRKQGKS
ncbi:phosphatidylinositol-specific phospholipase C/glycerophosphodiester phosphodiesterase family protein [Armatimonas sp.]|uniref:phosphatidylinositol-specific phospholipase C/glycerophosphodiester phosphodiesterase family protein n=1 Tax=Armatimonas sp. TaxID=1872638 RepID=UPI00286B5EB9|nr:phosphatidylinositol-specific phospholipase C/glycerophosphodiester phosphodiesterase family protein [Armatimonas sp.]